METNVEFRVVFDNESGLPVKVPVVASYPAKLKSSEILIVTDPKGKNRVLLIQYPQKGDPSYAWDPLYQRISKLPLIPFLLFLKKNEVKDSYINGFKGQIMELLEGVAKGDRKCISIIRSTDGTDDISELTELFKDAAVGLDDLLPKLKKLKIRWLLDMISEE